jgi:Pyruvate/2-oxoacid:ferredoxin oxidoreductase delta subunit
MCEFCLKHGEGKTWYLEASNYSEDLLSDLKRRRLIEEYYTRPDTIARSAERLEQIDSVPWLLRRFVRWNATRRQKTRHFGQIVPLEDVERILDLTNSVVRVACLCRFVTTGQEARYCYGVSMGTNGGRLGELFSDVADSYFTGPDSRGLEVLAKDEVMALFAQHEAEGLCHSVWTFGTPYVAGICNCDRPDCLAMKATIGHDVPVFFRAEYVARVDEEACVGCRACMERCQFGAMGYSAMHGTVFIDLRACYGCGVCRSACEHDAIHLEERKAVPAAAGLW